MLRPQRHAAVTALDKIREIRKWEQLSEDSEEFRQCAAEIEAELDQELVSNNVSVTDLDVRDVYGESAEDSGMVEEDDENSVVEADSDYVMDNASQEDDANDDDLSNIDEEATDSDVHENFSDDLASSTEDTEAEGREDPDIIISSLAEDMQPTHTANTSVPEQIPEQSHTTETI